MDTFWLLFYIGLFILLLLLKYRGCRITGESPNSPMNSSPDTTQQDQTNTAELRRRHQRIVHDHIESHSLVVNKRNDLPDQNDIDENIGPRNSHFVIHAHYQVLEDGNQCPICLLQMEYGQSISYSNNPACKHVYHRDCISEWFFRPTNESMNLFCPCCRQDFIMTVTSEHHHDEGGDGGSGQDLNQDPSNRS